MTSPLLLPGRIKIKNNKIERSQASKQIQVHEIQFPLSPTLITFKLKGFPSEQDALAYAAKFDIDKIKTLMGE